MPLAGFGTVPWATSQNPQVRQGPAQIGPNPGSAAVTNLLEWAPPTPLGHGAPVLPPQHQPEDPVVPQPQTHGIPFGPFNPKPDATPGQQHGGIMASPIAPELERLLGMMRDESLSPDQRRALKDKFYALLSGQVKPEQPNTNTLPTIPATPPYTTKPFTLPMVLPPMAAPNAAPPLGGFGPPVTWPMVLPPMAAPSAATQPSWIDMLSATQAAPPPGMMY